MKLDKNEIISAQVILLPASGQRIGPDIQITSGNLEKCAPPPEAYGIVTGIFKKNGVEIGPIVGVSFSITATVRLFESIFNTTLKRTVKDGIECVGEGLNLPLNNLSDHVRSLIQAVTFTEPPDFGPADFF